MSRLIRGSSSMNHFCFVGNEIVNAQVANVFEPEIFNVMAWEILHC